MRQKYITTEGEGVGERRSENHMMCGGRDKIYTYVYKEMKKGGNLLQKLDRDGEIIARPFSLAERKKGQRKERGRREERGQKGKEKRKKERKTIKSCRGREKSSSALM